jgi:ribonuclease VapC
MPRTKRRVCVGMARAVLDASVVMAVINREPGRDAALPYLVDAACSANTIAEVATKLSDAEASEAEIDTLFVALQLEIHPVDFAEAVEIGRLRRATRAGGLSLGDRSCLALARRLKRPAITMDRAWARVADAVGVEVRVLR